MSNIERRASKGRNEKLKTPDRRLFGDWEWDAYLRADGLCEDGSIFLTGGMGFLPGRKFPSSQH